MFEIILFMSPTSGSLIIYLLKLNGVLFNMNVLSVPNLYEGDIKSEIVLSFFFSFGSLGNEPSSHLSLVHLHCKLN